jgi:hypothetical protein
MRSESRRSYAVVESRSTKLQIPPDLVVKFQTVDIVEVIELSWSDEAHPKIV